MIEKTGKECQNN